MKANTAASSILPESEKVWPAIIIGAGQAGLSSAHELVRRGWRPGEDFLIVDAEDGPGGAWRNRWDSLTLGTSHRIHDLPGLALADKSSDVPASHVISDYYAQHEKKFGLEVLRPLRVESVKSTQTPGPPLMVEGKPEAANLLELTGEVEDRDGPSPSVHKITLRTRVIISATGTWRRPFIPYILGIETFGGRSLHTVDYVQAKDFRGLRTLVVGGGLSAVQFLLELAPETETIWATRRPPNFTTTTFDEIWGAEVETAVDARTVAGKRPASVVRTTGIPQLPQYLAGVAAGTLVSHGMIDRIRPGQVRFRGENASKSRSSDGLGPSSSPALAVPQSWQPYSEPTWVPVDVIFWNTGFRADIGHLRPLKLRTDSGGIQVDDRVRAHADPRVLLAGYGSGASTFGATRTGKAAARAAVKLLG